MLPKSRTKWFPKSGAEFIYGLSIHLGTDQELKRDLIKQQSGINGGVAKLWQAKLETMDAKTEFELALGKTEDLGQAVRNVVELGRCANGHLLAQSESSEMQQEAYARFVCDPIQEDLFLSVQFDCYSDDLLDHVKSIVEPYSEWVRSAVTLLFVASKAWRFLHKHLEGISDCVWKDKYRVILREHLILNDFEKCYEFDFLFDTKIKDIEKTLSAYLEQLNESSKIANTIGKLFELEIDLNEEWIPLSERQLIREREQSRSEAKVSTNAKMLEYLQKHPEAAAFSVRQWAEAINKSVSTIHATQTWANLRQVMHMGKLELLERQSNAGNKKPNTRKKTS